MGKKYIDSRSWKYKVMSGLGDNTYKAQYQRAGEAGRCWLEGAGRCAMADFPREGPG